MGTIPNFNETPESDSEDDYQIPGMPSNIFFEENGLEDYDGGCHEDEDYLNFSPTEYIDGHNTILTLDDLILCYFRGYLSMIFS